MAKKIGETHKQVTDLQRNLVGIKPYIATPAYDGKVDSDYALSLADSVMLAASLGVGCTVACMGNGAFIDIARNNFVRMFLETDCTHLFFIDADLKWEPRAFIGLLAGCVDERPVVAGMYRRRQDPEEYPVKYVEADEGGLQVVQGGWVECERVPTGFLCIQRNIIEEMAKDAKMWKQHKSPDIPALFYTQVLEDGRYMGEDFSWCDDYCERYDTHIHVWPDFDFVHGGYECNWHSFMNEQVDKYEQAKSMKVIGGGK